MSKFVPTYELHVGKEVFGLPTGMPSEVGMAELLVRYGMDAKVVVTFKEAPTAADLIRDAYNNTLRKTSVYASSLYPSGICVASDVYQALDEELKDQERTGMLHRPTNIPKGAEIIISFDGMRVYEVPGMPSGTVQFII